MNTARDGSMNSNPKLSYAIAATLSGSAAGFAHAATATDTEASDALQEITVTAQRRTENIQNVPITIQALTGETLKELSVATFDDYVRYLPNVSDKTNGPGQSVTYMRGLSAGGVAGAQSTGSTTNFPNVAIYLDDQSGQLPGRNLDIYAADLERIEVLEGPQGTLFGAGAEAGVLRYITNKPKLNVTEATVDASYGVTAHGDPSSAVNAIINPPLLQDRLAVRAVLYNDSRGGYINNLPATFSRASTDRVVVNYFGGVVPPNSGPINNSGSVANAINPVTYQGGRAELLYQINDDWKALITQAYQDLDAEGVFWAEQYDGLGTPLPDLAVEQFGPSYNKDKFENTAWTLDGRIAALRVVYAGAYLDRNIDQLQDYTNYSRATYAGYYQCNYPGYPFVGFNPTPGTPGYCYSPHIFWTDHQTTTHQSHELRLSTPGDWRVRGLAGAFWEKYTIHEQTDWFYGTS